MKINIANELVFKTARSGGKGGQNVNKVETMVEGRWNIAASNLITSQQKEILQMKLYTKINFEGFLLVKSQEARTQLSNKELVVFKINEIVNKALVKKKIRIATKTSKKGVEERLTQKKVKSSVKQTRKKVIVDL